MDFAHEPGQQFAKCQGDRKGRPGLHTSTGVSLQKVEGHPLCFPLLTLAGFSLILLNKRIYAEGDTEVASRRISAGRPERMRFSPFRFARQMRVPSGTLP